MIWHLQIVNEVIILTALIKWPISISRAVFLPISSVQFGPFLGFFWAHYDDWNRSLLRVHRDIDRIKNDIDQITFDMIFDMH